MWVICKLCLQQCLHVATCQTTAKAQPSLLPGFLFQVLMQAPPPHPLAALQSLAHIRHSSTLCRQATMHDQATMQKQVSHQSLTTPYAMYLLQAEHKQEPPAPAPAPAPAKQDVQVGSSSGMSQRNPLDLIKTDVPLLSEATTSKQPRTLGPLIDAAGRDEQCVWHRVCPLFLQCSGVFNQIMSNVGADMYICIETAQRSCVSSRLAQRSISGKT